KVPITVTRHASWTAVGRRYRELGDVARVGEPSNLVCFEFGEGKPQIVTSHNPFRAAVRAWQDEVFHDAPNVDSPNLVAVILREPHVLAGGDVCGTTSRSRDREFGDHGGGLEIKPNRCKHRQRHVECLGSHSRAPPEATVLLRPSPRHRGKWWQLPAVSPGPSSRRALHT